MASQPANTRVSTHLEFIKSRTAFNSIENCEASVNNSKSNSLKQRTIEKLTYFKHRLAKRTVSVKIVTAVATFQHIFGNTVGTRPESGKILLKYQEKQVTRQVKVV